MQATRGVNDPPQGQLACPVLLLVCCVLKPTPVVAHRQVFYTACPGHHPPCAGA
jgi:hypothetical protein